MDRGEVQEKRFDRKIRLEHRYDRLVDIKMVQVYQLLVPDKVWFTEMDQQMEGQKHETGGNICEGIL
jgi:hypothetical protein